MTYFGSPACGPSVQPAIDKLISIVSKCTSGRKVSRILGYMQRNGMESRASFQNSLELISIDSGSIPSAQKIFDVENDASRQALSMCQNMSKEVLEPSKFVIVTLLKFCAKWKDIRRGIAIHAEIMKNRCLLDGDIFIGCTLMDMYAKCGNVTKASEVFDDLAIRNVVAWNVLISGYARHERGTDALKCFQRMCLEGISPNVVTYISTLKACGAMGAINEGSQIHAEIQQQGLLEKDVNIGNSLVDMYARCGSLIIAQELFDSLPKQDTAAWNILISGYVKHGFNEKALYCFKQMKCEGVSPDAITFASSLKACGGAGAIVDGKALHSEIKRNGLGHTNIIVRNALVDMYAKCGLLKEANELFDMLPSRDIISWNSLISGYAESGHNEHVLNYFEQMQFEGVSPDVVTFSCSLKACGNMGLMDKGISLHAELEKKGLVGKVIGNALVTMYGKCGQLAKAWDEFDSILERGIVSWNAMIAGFLQHDCGLEVLNCLDLMELEGVSPNTITFLCSLKACSIKSFMEEGQRIHAEVVRKGFLEKDPVLDSALVDMYAKHGLLAEAHAIFDKLPRKDLASWNSLISGYAECDCGDIAVSCFAKMRREGLTPDIMTVSCCLKACGNIGDMVTGLEIHAEIEKSGFLERDIVVGNSLLDMYVKGGLLSKACEVFEKIPVRNVVSWSTMISGYAKHEKAEEALRCFSEMQLKGITPDAITFSCSLKACSCIGDLSKGVEIHAEIEKLGLLGKDPVVGNALIDMYAKCGYLFKAQEIIYSIPDHDVVSWNALIGGYVKHEQDEEALNSFEKLQAERIPPDTVTFALILKACGNIGVIEQGKRIHIEIERKRFLEQSNIVGNALVDMYAKCGLVTKAQEVFDKLLNVDLVSWNVLIAGYAQTGQCEKVFGILGAMETKGVKPDSSTFLNVLHACSHGGLLLEASILFKSMIEEYEITPIIEHFTSTIDLLSRVGQLHDAVSVLEKVPLHPDIVMWSAMLGGCKKWSNIYLARQAFQHALGLDEREVSTYVSMYNIYVGADTHKSEMVHFVASF